MYFLKLATGNLIKNRKNSLTILVVVFICVFTMQFGTGYIDGFREKITTDFLKTAGHVNIYNEKYYNDPERSLIGRNVPYNKGIINNIKSVPNVTHVRPEINFGAIANTEQKNLQCVVKAIDAGGIDENYEARKNSVIDGNFIKEKNDIALGYKAAKLLKIKTGDSLILLSVGRYGSINAVEGRVSGLFKSNVAVEDESMAVCGIGMAQNLLGLDGRVTSIAVNFADPLKAPARAEELQKLLPAGIVAVPWQTGKAFIVNMLKMFDVMVLAFSFLLIFAASMGIINSFLMNIMNRLPEFGVMRAMGLSRARMFFMILAESFILGSAGTALGIIPGVLIVRHFEANPLSFENIWGLMEGSGIGSMDASIGMVFVPASFVIVVLTGVLISVIASIYPAIIAVKKKPSDVMRVTE